MSSRSASHHPRVLIVEDEYIIADDLRRLLTENGYDVVGPVSTAAAASDQIGGGKVDAVVLDVNLGGESSFPLAAQLQQAAMPFVFLTGYDRAAIPSDLGAAGYLQKPHEDLRVVEAIERQLAGPAPEAGGTNGRPMRSKP